MRQGNTQNPSKVVKMKIFDNVVIQHFVWQKKHDEVAAEKPLISLVALLK